MTTAGPELRRDDGWRRYRPIAGAGPAVLLMLVAIWEISSVALAGHDVPDDGDWRRAAAYLGEHKAEGELVVVAPDWLDPVFRQHLGEDIPIEVAARMDAARFGAIWELSARGMRAPETAGLEVAKTVEFGELTLRRFEHEAAVIVTDFVEALGLARVEGAIAQRPQVKLEEVGFEPHRCVRVVPRPGGTVTLTYPSVELGNVLVGYVGLADVFTRRDVRAPGRLEVRVGDATTSVTAGVDDGWLRFSLATTPGRADVVFEATAVGAEARDRRICFAAEARR